MRRGVAEQAREAVEALVGSMGYDLVDTEYRKEGPNWILRFLIDRRGGIGIEDCVAVTRAVSPEIDRLVDMPGPYHLEVSSPGLTRPLRTPADWIRHEGEEVDVDFLSETDAAVRATGVLAGYDAETEILSIRTGEGGMNLVGIPRTRIREVRRTIRFR